MAYRRPRYSHTHLEPAPNLLVDHFADVLERAYAEHILPDLQTAHRFGPGEAPLYVSDRRWPSLDDTLTKEDPHRQPFLVERLIDTYFWAEDKPRLLLVEGPVGCGKSTLVDYYLRCYCPTVSAQRAHFDSKLIVNVDFRSAPSPAEFDKRLFQHMKLAIESHCKRKSYAITLINNFQMWETIFDFESDVMTSRFGDTRSSSFRKNYIARHAHAVPPEAWVMGALRLLTKEIRTGKAPFRFLVLCLDNLDQSESDVWAHAIWRVRDWLEHADIEIWRVILPLRPTTFMELSDRHSPLPGYEPLTIAPPDIDEVFRTRDDLLTNAISAEPESPFGRGSLATKESLIAFVTNTRSWASHRFHKLLSALSGGSTRKMVELWKQTLSNKGLFEGYRYRADNVSITPLIGNYFLIAGMLKGRYRLFNAAQHSIPNLFNIYNADLPGPRSMLLGPHALSLLRAGVTDLSQIRRMLHRLRYQHSAISHVLLIFKQMRLYRPVRVEQIHPDDAAISALWSLMCEPAYIDNVALVTPVPVTLHHHLTLVESGTAEDFLIRSRSGLAFLSQLRSDELAFCEGDDGIAEHERRAFHDALRELSIPSVFKGAAREYQENILFLQDRYYKTLTNADWTGLLEHAAVAGLSLVDATLQPPARPTK